jgi:hypothetical protein
MWNSNKTAHTFFGRVHNYETAHDVAGTGHGEDEIDHEVAETGLCYRTDPWAERNPYWDPDLAFSYSAFQTCHQFQDRYCIAWACYQTGSHDHDQKPSY